MLLSYLQGKDYNEFTKNIEGLYSSIEKIEKLFYKLRDNEKVDMLTRAAFIAKSDIIDKLRKYRWDLNKAVYIKKLGGARTLKFAYNATVGKIEELSQTLKDHYLIISILEDQQTHDKWKKIYFYFDAENNILTKYPNVLRHLATEPIAYVRRVGIDYFTLYTRREKTIVLYTFTETNNKIKVHIRCEDISSINDEGEIEFAVNTEEMSIAVDSEKLMFDLQERLIHEISRQGKW